MMQIMLGINAISIPNVMDMSQTSLMTSVQRLSKEYSKSIFDVPSKLLGSSLQAGDRGV